MYIPNFVLKDIVVEQFFVLINPVSDLSPVHTMTGLADFGQIYYLKISLNDNMYTHISLTVSSIIMPGWVGASKNNLASVILQSTKKNKKLYFLECSENLLTLFIKIKMLQDSETLPEIGLSGQPCKLGSLPFLNAWSNNTLINKKNQKELDFWMIWDSLLFVGQKIEMEQST